MRALCDAGLRRLGSAFYITALCKLARLHSRTRRGLSSLPQPSICGTLHPPLAVRSRLWQLRAAARSAGALHHPPPRAPAHALRGPALPPPNPRAGRPAAPRRTAPAHARRRRGRATASSPRSAGRPPPRGATNAARRSLRFAGDALALLACGPRPGERQLHDDASAVAPLTPAWPLHRRRARGSLR
jgi:hypothetical protein